MVQAAVAVAAGDEGQLDIAVNSAGFDGSGSMPSGEWTGEMLDEMLAVNVRGTFLPMKYELEIVHRQGSGAIVNIGSGRPSHEVAPARSRRTSRRWMPRRRRPAVSAQYGPRRLGLRRAGRESDARRRSFCELSGLSVGDGCRPQR
jgi:NAD(P)-dependent dehydrogenase (short-subunit alcohol dehydrogenase family)